MARVLIICKEIPTFHKKPPNTMNTPPVVPRVGSLTTFASLTLALVSVLLFNRCTDQVEATVRYTHVRPVYTTTETLRNSVSVMPAKTVTGTGKLFAHDSYLFLNQPGEGIHIIDNTDPSNPSTISFINIPGNFDLAAKGDILYADSYIDLLALDISDPLNVQVVKRVENVFPRYNSYGHYTDEQLGIVTSWVEEETVEIYEGDMNGYQEYGPGMYLYNGGFAMEEASLRSFANDASVPVINQNNQVIGKAGSLARFAVDNDQLYTVDDNNMQVFDINQLTDPVSVNNMYVGFMIETIFPYKDKLFIGSQNGMFIYETSNPGSPTHVSSFEHATSCDPVVANDSIAYVTLRSGNTCEGVLNQLDIVDVRDVYSPYLMMSYSMENPHGLGIDGTTLFVCEGEYGLKVFDASNTYAIDQNLIAHFQDVHAYDVIPMNGILMMIGDDGLYQYDYTDLSNIRLLSKLTVAAL